MSFLYWHEQLKFLASFQTANGSRNACNMLCGKGRVRTQNLGDIEPYALPTVLGASMYWYVLEHTSTYDFAWSCPGVQNSRWLHAVAIYYIKWHVIALIVTCCFNPLHAVAIHYMAYMHTQACVLVNWIYSCTRLLDLQYCRSVTKTS